jgi:K+ transporter
MTADDAAGTDTPQPLLPKLAPAATGVVFGDIATSPLYSLMKNVVDEN